jgi:pre-mRNA-processing factor 40
MQTDRRTATVEKESMSLIFERLREKVQRRSDEDKHHAERHQRRAIDALRSKIKRLEPAVVASDTWEQVRPRIEKFEEFRALDSDELRHSAFDKVIRRLKEKEDDYEKEKARRDQRDRERDRDRDGRNGHSRHRRTRSPEADPYEADRKKAMADRERQYKSNKMGLSPRRDREEWDRFDKGLARQGSHYERERRERDVERERTYVSRADPRDPANVELDYGESRPSNTRRRRDSDGGSPSSRRDSKRQRRERDSREPTYSPRRNKTRTPQPAEPKEDPGLKSGSEEGEIEEA